MLRFGKLILEKVTILTPATETELVIMNSEYLYTYVLPIIPT